MKKLLNLILGIAVLAAFSLATVNAATTVSGSRSNQCEMTGTVSQVDAAAKTFTVSADGKQYKFRFPKSGMKHKVGAVIRVTANEEASTTNPVQARYMTVVGSNSFREANPKASPTPAPNAEKNVKSSKSNSSDRATTVQSSKSNGSFRTAASPSPSPKAK